LQKVSRTIEEVLGRLTVWDLRETPEDSAQITVDGELVRIEVSGGNHGK
jgi:hypothetical protein